MTETPFKLESIKLQNFRCFTDITIDLHPRLTVLVAENGQGKTAILDAIRIGLWPLVGGFDLAKSGSSDRANTITIDDVLLRKQTDFGNSRQLPSCVVMKGNYLSMLDSIINGTNPFNDYEWVRYRVSEAKRSQIKDDNLSKMLKTLASLVQDKIRKPDSNIISLPIFGYYGTGRLWNEKRLTEKKSTSKTEKIDQSIRTFAYRDCLDPASSYKQFESWFTTAFKKFREEQIIQLEKGESSGQVSSQVKNPIKVVQTAVNEVLKETGWNSLSYSETSDQSLILEHSEKATLKVDQLSDGIKNMLALVADIAYRCALLNPHLGAQAAIESQGLVMIDEVDMHLHPKWQQTVLDSLLRAFPKIQFIVTTHSPQVLTTVKRENIRVLTQDAEGKFVAEMPNKSPLGHESGDALSFVMKVATRPSMSFDDLVKGYEQLVRNGLEISDDAHNIKRQLDELGYEFAESDLQTWRFLASRKRSKT